MASKRTSNMAILQISLATGTNTMQPVRNKAIHRLKVTHKVKAILKPKDTPSKATRPPVMEHLV